MALSTAAPGKGGQDVLDGVDFGVALGQGGGAIGGADVYSTRASISGLPSRSTRRKRMPELGGAGRKVMLTPVAAMQPDAGETRRLAQSLLI